MSCLPEIVLQDSNGVLRAFTLDDSGMGSMDVVGSGAPMTPILTDFGRGQTAWEIFVRTDGILDVNQVPLAGYDTFVQMQTSGPLGLVAWLTVTEDGNLQSIVRGPEGTTYVVGQLFPTPAGAQYTQIGGIGGEVTPTQTVEERMVARYVPACSHGCNSLDIRQAFIGCDLCKVVTCSQCGFIVRLITPISVWDDDPSPLVA